MQWYKELSVTERRTFGAFGGWAVDALDFMVFTFVISTLINLWGIDKGRPACWAPSRCCSRRWAAGSRASWPTATAACACCNTPSCGSRCTVAIGFAQNFEQLFVLRALQGLGFGGEWAVGSVLMGEIVRAQHRGKAVGTVQSGWAVGWGAAAILYTLAFSLLPPEWAWRSLFWIGVLPAFLVLYIRKHVPEPEVFQRNLARQRTRRSARPSGRSSRRRCSRPRW